MQTGILQADEDEREAGLPEEVADASDLPVPGEDREDRVEQMAQNGDKWQKDVDALENAKGQKDDKQSHGLTGLEPRACRVPDLDEADKLSKTLERLAASSDGLRQRTPRVSTLRKDAEGVSESSVEPVLRSDPQSQSHGASALPCRLHALDWIRLFLVGLMMMFAVGCVFACSTW